jgi:hypothetical protein
MKLTPDQKKACFDHAKEHVLEALREAATDEHHSIITLVSGTEKSDTPDYGHDGVMAFFEMFLMACEGMSVELAEKLMINRRNSLLASIAKKEATEDFTLEDMQRELDLYNAVVEDG